MRETERDLRRRAEVEIAVIIVSQSGGFGHSRGRCQRRRHYSETKGRNFERENKRLELYREKVEAIQTNKQTICGKSEREFWGVRLSCNREKERDGLSVGGR